MADELLDRMGGRTEYTLIPGEGGNGERDANGKVYPTGAYADRGDASLRTNDKTRQGM